MKKLFISPEIEIINFILSDIITTSGLSDESDYESQTAEETGTNSPTGGEIELPIDPF